MTTLRNFLLLSGLMFSGVSASAQPVRVLGEFNYKSADVANYFALRATAELLCVSQSLKASPTEWVPKTEQILGNFVGPVYPAPLRFEIKLPIAPVCKNIDLDNNGRKDVGVQVFVAMTAADLYGDSYLEQVEQLNGFTSILQDSKDKTVARGSFLIFSPDDKQRISSGFGPDKRLFTQDDPTVRVPQGYSLMQISKDRVITFDRSTDLKMEIVQEEQARDADFSGMGILQSFDALIDLLKERYAYTELRKINWEAKRSEYRPRVTKADSEKDLEEYYVILREFASRMNDGHVQVSSYDPKLVGKWGQAFRTRFAGSLGAQVIRYTDGRIVVIAVAKDSAAEKAGFKVGTEIVRINGQGTLEHLRSLPPLGFSGTEEVATNLGLRFLLSFPLNESVTVEFRQPGETENKTATMIAGQYELGSPFPTQFAADTVTMRRVGDGKYGYFRWTSFQNASYDIAGLETFLMGAGGDPGVVLDLRGNGGGMVALYFTMASYFFPPEKAVSMNWLDTYEFDEFGKKFEKVPGDGDLKLSAPHPEIAYKGNVVVLVDGESASGAEFFSQFLQKTGRATVIADSGTAGAGGGLRRAIMPGKIPFAFTGSQMYYAGTKEPNLEAKGVIADVRVPINEDYVRRRLNGEDVVLSEAVKFLDSKTKKDLR